MCKVLLTRREKVCVRFCLTRGEKVCVRLQWVEQARTAGLQILQKASSWLANTVFMSRF